MEAYIENEIFKKFLAVLDIYEQIFKMIVLAPGMMTTGFAAHHHYKELSKNRKEKGEKKK